MRAIYKKYSDKVNALVLITHIDQLKQNITTIENYLTEDNEAERLEASNLIKNGNCFVGYKIDDELRFAPSRFLGYQNNNLFKHSMKDKDGRETNKAINKILSHEPLVDEVLEQRYLGYCISLGIKPQLQGGSFARKRKYWRLNLEHDFQNSHDLPGEFPEGKLIERIHKTRERNPKVIKLAKQKFKTKHGKLFCQVCKFDFENNYGGIGIDFIEGHHTVAVKEMSPNHKTKPEEIAMLCSNCHRMVHKKRPWLTMEQLSKILKK